MKSLSARERNLVLLFLAVALVIGLPGLLLPPAAVPGTHSLAQEKSRRNRARIKLAQLARENGELRDRVDARISEGSVRTLIPAIVQAAQESARTAGVRLTDLKPSSPESMGGLTRIPVQVNLSATFSQAVRFLYELQRRSKRFRVDQLRLVSTDTRSDALNIDLRMVGYLRSDLPDGAAKNEGEISNGNGT